MSTILYLRIYYSLEEGVVHVAWDLLGSSPVDLVDLLGVWVVGVQASELALDITEEEEEVGTVAAVDDVQNAVARLGVDHAGKHDVLDGVQDDGPVRLAGRLTVQPRACKKQQQSVGDIFS